MEKSMKVIISFAALLLAVLSQTIFAAQSGQSSFKKGEVAVYASPAELKGYKIKKYLPHAGISVIELLPGKEWGLVQKLRLRGKRAGLNLIANKSASDPLYAFQWHLNNVQAEDAWGLSTGSGVTVAVLDTGLAPGGPDGVKLCEPNAGFDIVNNDSDPMDGDGHGTHVSGTIAQNTNNGVGVAGLAYDACVMPVKVLDDTGSGDFADIADGIHYAVDKGAQVINMSLGTDARFGVKTDPVMDSALDYAYGRGVTVVAAAGNDGHRKNVSYPAIYKTTIGVGATDYKNQLTRYSNKGVGLDLVAPGGNLRLDDNGDSYGDGVLQEMFNINGWAYFFLHGTSMASPHVAAAAALLISKNGTALTPDQIRAALTGYAKDLGKAGYDKQYGHGLLQVYSSLTGGATLPEPPASDDADGDGFTVSGGDCDDNDASIYPGANDTKGKKGRDGIDNDCNGIIDG